MANDLRGTTSTVETQCLYIEQDRLDRRRRVRCQRVGGRTTIEDTLGYVSAKRVHSGIPCECLITRPLPALGDT
jgi:hypothetical protein